jgi:hypothetical protein
MIAIDGPVVARKRSSQYVPPTAKRAKTETLSLRLDPKTKFMLDFLARVQGQSITTVVERAVHQVASRVSVAPFDENDKTWAMFWDASEGIRTLKLIADPHYPTNYEEDELLSFAKVHWPFFYLTEKTITPKQSYVDLLWPKIDLYLDLWRTLRQENYWAAGEAMRADLLAAKIAAPDWPIVKSAPRGQSRESFSAELDVEIPF